MNSTHKNRLRRTVIIAIGTFAIGVFAVIGWLRLPDWQKAPTVASVSRFDSVMFNDQYFNRVLALANISELRKVSTKNDDIEVRIWRGAFLGSEEAVLLRRVGGKWSGRHLAVKVGETYDDMTVEVNELNPPKSGWNYFWGKLVGKGLLTLPLSPEVECRGVDSIGYVVEINQDNTYRNYQYSGDENCRETKQMNEIGEIIGIEFYSGQEECKSTAKETEWFACMALRASQGQ